MINIDNYTKAIKDVERFNSVPLILIDSKYINLNDKKDFSSYLKYITKIIIKIEDLSSTFKIIISNCEFSIEETMSILNKINNNKVILVK
jgi:hypothetical protein